MRKCRNAGMQKCGRRWPRLLILAFVHSCILALLLSPPLVRVANGETIDRVLAVVAGDLITLSDVHAALDLGLIVPAARAADPVRDVLSQLIDRELELAEVDRYGQPEPTAEAIDGAVQAVRSRFASQQAFEAVLARAGIDLPHVRETVRENLRIRAYLDQRFATGGDRRQQLMDDWLQGLRRRAEIIDLYVAGR
jgi:hypothetical protein